MAETVAQNDAARASTNRVTVGVDTHLDEHVAVALDYMGCRLDVLTIPTNEVGYVRLLRWAASLGRLERVGIEGAGSFGAGLARFLMSRNVEVLEVGRPKRRDQHRAGKSDPIDAELAARAVLSGTVIGEVKDTDGRVEMIRVLRVARRSAVKARAQAANQLKGMIITAPEDLRTVLRGLSVAKLVRQAARFRPGDLTEDTTSATKFATDVRTAPATVADGEATPLIHEALEKKGLLPETQFIDTGYLDAELLFESKARYGVDLFGPTRPDRKWQAKEGTGFEAAAFSLDWENGAATCPEGKKSISWTPAIDNTYNHVVKIKFSSKDCMPCPSRDLCIRSTRRWKRRSITVRAHGHQQALQAARKREKESGFAATYARIAGIEGTISRAVRTCDLRRSRYVGLEKTQLHHLLSAAALNFLRVVGEWLSGMEKPRSRCSPFARLMAQPAAA